VAVAAVAVTDEVFIRSLLSVAVDLLRPLAPRRLLQHQLSSRRLLRLRLKLWTPVVSTVSLRTTRFILLSSALSQRI
jgi:hypothetical protein